MEKDKTVSTVNEKRSFYNKMFKERGLDKPIDYIEKKDDYASTFEIPYFKEQHEKKLKINSFESSFDYVMLIFSFICIIGLLLITINI